MGHRMKLTIKTLDQRTFQIEFDDSRTVWDLKTQLFSMPDFGIEPDKQQLIYSGRVLENESPLREYSIDERKFLVMLAKKALVTNTNTHREANGDNAETVNVSGGGGGGGRAGVTESTQSSDSINALNPQAAAAAAATAASPDITEASPYIESVLTALQNATTVTPDSNLVQQIMVMGYPEEEVKRALSASFNNPDRAIEYLIEGIPNLTPPTAGHGMQASHAGAQAATDGSNDQQSAPQQVLTAEAALRFLRNDPRFAEMRRVFQQNPAVLGTVLGRIAETNPSLLMMIQDNQDEFLRLINDDIDSDYGENENNLSPEEREAVERLVGMGFPREMVLQIYLACDKNEAQTADFLCRYMDENQ